MYKRAILAAFCALILEANCEHAISQSREEMGRQTSDSRRSSQSVSNRRRSSAVAKAETFRSPKQSITETPDGVENANGNPTFDLATLQAIAIQNSPSLYESSAYIDSLIGKRTQAGLWPNPDVGFSGQQVASRGLAEQRGVIIGQRIITAQKLRTDQAVVTEEIRRAQFRYDAQKLRVETDVAIAFYECLAAQRLLELARELARISEEGLATVERLKLASEASRIDTLQAKIELESSYIRKDNAENRLDAAWRNLSTVVSESKLPRLTLVGSLEDGFVEFAWDNALAQLLEQSPELSAAKATADRARWAHQRAMREVYPNIDASGIVQSDNATRGWNGAIQVSIPVPIINRNQGGIREALANIAVAEQAYERTQLQLENRLAKVFEQYANASRQSQRYKNDLIPAAQEQLSLTKKVLENGEIPYINFLTAQRSFSQVMIGEVEARRDLAVTSSRIAGLLLEGSLESQDLAP